jgi:hypothetical protein
VKLELGRGEKCGRERKERNEGDARVLYGQREREGEAEGGVAAGGLAIDSRRAKRRKEQKEGGGTASNGGD